MLQCSGCGGLVSEFAARCPQCGRGVEDATYVADGRTLDDPYLDHTGTELVTPPPRTAEDGPRPPPRPRRARTRPTLLLLAAVVVSGGLAVGVGTTWGGSARSPALSILRGRIVAATPAKDVLAVDPASGRSTPYGGIRRGAAFAPVAVSPDGIDWLEADGRLATMGPRAVTVRPTTATGFLSPGTSLASAEPFAATGRFVVAQTRLTSGSSDAWLLGLKCRHRFDLGIVDSAGGDHQSLGAFVSVPADPTHLGPSDYATPFVHVYDGGHRLDLPGYATPDRDVELRRAGRPPAVLATAAQLDQDLGWLPDTAVHLGVYPSPTGDALAVVVQPLRPYDGDVPMVLLTRDGGLLATLGDWSGPMYGTGPVWSRDGRQLAFPTYTATGPALTIATESGDVEARPAPGAATRIGHCLWSPNSLDVVCDATSGNRLEWLYATPASNRLVPVAAPGQLLAWVTSAP